MNFADEKIKAPLGLDYIFTFGKHKDEYIRDVLETDPSYIIWCADNIDWFDLDTVVYDKAYESANAGFDPDYDEYRQHRDVGDDAKWRKENGLSW